MSDTDDYDLWLEECSDSPEQALAGVYDQACAQYERAEKLEAELAAERERCEVLRERMAQAAAAVDDLRVALVQARIELMDALKSAMAEEMEQ